MFVLQGRYLFTNIDAKFLLIFKFANHRTKEPFVSPTNKALVGTLITIGDIIDIFAIGDVNINILRAQAFKLARQFFDCLQSYALFLTIDKPTRVYNNSVKRIDNIFTNKFCEYFASESIASDITNHFSQFCIFQIFY